MQELPSIEANLTHATAQFIFASMTHLENPSFDVKEINNDGGDTVYRLTVSTETVVIKLDLTTYALADLCTEALEEIAENEASFDACSLCGDGSLNSAAACEFVTLRDIAQRIIRAHKRKIIGGTVGG